MFGRFSNSWALARSSWHVLRTDKQLLVFPFISGIGCLLVLLSFAVPFLANPTLLDSLNNKNGGDPSPWLYVLAFAYYFCNYFVIVFCNAALISCAMIRFNGGEPTVGDGFSAAMSRLPQIAAWALVSATIGLALKVVENAHEKAGKFITMLLGTAWTVITFFVVPVLVVEKVGPFQAISRSLSILKKTWGEALVGQWGIGLFMFLLLLPCIALFIAGGLLATTVQARDLAVLAVAAVYFLVWLAISSAMHGIYLGALYQFAAYNRVPDGFEPETMAGASRRRDAKRSAKNFAGPRTPEKPETQAKVIRFTFACVF